MKRILANRVSLAARPMEHGTCADDGKHTAYSAKRGEDRLVVRDRAEGREYDLIRRHSSPFSPDAELLAYAAARSGKWVVVANE